MPNRSLNSYGVSPGGPSTPKSLPYRLRRRYISAASLGGWVSFLSGLAILLLVIIGYRWLRKELLWRLRNRLIVTYMFIGVIPVILLVVMSLFTLYLLAGQFASFVVTSEITSHLRSMEAANRAIANEVAGPLQRGQKPDLETLAGMRSKDPSLRAAASRPTALG